MAVRGEYCEEWSAIDLSIMESSTTTRNEQDITMLRQRATLIDIDRAQVPLL